MKKIYPKLIVVGMILIISWMVNFRYQYEPPVPAASQPQSIKKIIIVKKVYIRVPVQVDSTQADTTIITLPKELPTTNYKKYYRSRNLHKSGLIS